MIHKPVSKPKAENDDKFVQPAPPKPNIVSLYVFALVLVAAALVIVVRFAAPH